jgi:Reverse transcriptase (RNA-dependent DNA polymerase)
LNNKIKSNKFGKRVSELLLNNNNNDSLPMTLNEAIMLAAEEICPLNTKKKQDWFTNGKTLLSPIINDRNRYFKEWFNNPNETSKLLLSSTRKKLRHQVTEAKNAWVNQLVNDLNNSEKNNNPKDTWTAIKQINKNLVEHHSKPIDLNFEKPDGTPATTDTENIELITKHFYEVFNNNNTNVNVPEVLSKLGPALSTFKEMEEVPTIKEIEEALKRMKNFKAPGPLGIPAEALKALETIGLDHLQNTIIKIFDNPDNIPSEWHEVNLKCLHKKGPKKNPSNWRGICLKEPIAKLLSSIINQRLLKIFSIVGTDNQYGCQQNKGCTDGIYVLRSILQTRRHHNLESWVLFADIVKAFDSVSHELLFELLIHYGTPKKIVDIIKALYTGTSVNIKVGKENAAIPYTVGVQQGDNMAPTLFLFAMLAFSNIIDKNWSTTWNLKPLQFNFFDKLKGRLLTQSTSSKGKIFTMPYLLYVDDSAFVFEERSEIEKGSQHIYDTFKEIGFIMHVGTEGSKSKSEAMYIAKSFIEDENNSNLPNDIITNEGTISFCNNFKYLGSIINNNLRDDNEISTRIKKANSQFGSLKSVLLGKTLHLHTKINLFNAIIINTVLWGCESWTVSKASENQLISFQHKSLRRILKISIYEVVENHITNVEVRKRALNSPNIIDIISARQLIWIGRIAKMNVDQIPRKLLACWSMNKRKPGRPQLNMRNSFAKSIQKVIPYVPNDLALEKWLPIAEQKCWKNIVKKWIENTESVIVSEIVNTESNPP